MIHIRYVEWNGTQRNSLDPRLKVFDKLNET